MIQLESLRIQNFRGFDNLEMNDFSNINVLLVENLIEVISDIVEQCKQDVVKDKVNGGKLVVSYRYMNIAKNLKGLSLIT